MLATLSRWRSRVRSPSDALSVVTARKCYVVCCLCPGEPSRDGYIVECVVCIVWEVCADYPSSYARLAESGRRAGLRNQCLRASEFKSRGGHENVMELVNIGGTKPPGGSPSMQVRILSFS